MVFQSLMVQEIDEFWQPALEQNCIDPELLQIDYENLNGIAIYVALKAGLPILIVDVLYVEQFVSEAIMTTNRAYQMTALHSALVFIEENLPTFYEAKDKTNPLAGHNFTPSFYQGSSGGLQSIIESAKNDYSYYQHPTGQSINVEEEKDKNNHSNVGSLRSVNQIEVEPISYEIDEEVRSTTRAPIAKEDLLFFVERTSTDALGVFEKFNRITSKCPKCKQNEDTCNCEQKDEGIQLQFIENNENEDRDRHRGGSVIDTN